MVNAISLFCILIIFYSTLTIARNDVWNDPIAFFEIDKKQTYESYRPGMMLADAYMERGDLINARKNYEEIAGKLMARGFTDLPPKMLFNLAVAYERFQNYPLAETLLKTCLAKAPKYQKAHFSLGVSYYQQKKYLLSYLAFKKAYQLAPHDAVALTQARILTFKVINLCPQLLEFDSGAITFLTQQPHLSK